MVISPRRSLPWEWGATRAEATAGYPCDRFAPESGTRAVRAVTTSASADACFLWLCQLRRAPYSYDLIDNGGRRSPRGPDVTLTDLDLDQSFMTIFRLAAFVPQRSVTLVMKPGRPMRVFGAISLTYAVVEHPSHSRLISAMHIPPVGRVLPEARRLMLAWGDLVMMRKQLTVLATLAERDPDGTFDAEGGRSRWDGR